MANGNSDIKELRQSSKGNKIFSVPMPDYVEAVASKKRKGSFVIVNTKPVIGGKQYILNGTLTLLS